MKKTKRSVVLTGDERPAIMAHDTETHQHLLELKERAGVIKVLRERLASRGRKKERTVDEFFREFFAKNNI